MYLSLPLTIVWDLVGYFLSSSLNFLICEMEIIRVPTSQSYLEKLMRCVKLLSQYLKHDGQWIHVSQKKKKAVNLLSNIYIHHECSFAYVCTNNDYHLKIIHDNMTDRKNMFSLLS